jgi:outer membrane protein assembly factor BamB
MIWKQLCTLLAVALLAAVGGWIATGSEPATAKDKEKAAEPVDVLDKVKEWNSDKFAPPPTEFRQGHVTEKKLDGKELSKTKDGFTIKLPAGAPIPTPSVYKGKLFVSGGFHSREYYCFNADNGQFVWGLNLDDDGPTSAAVEDDVIVFNTESCTLFALDATTGKHLWSYWLGDPLTSTPTIAKGRVFTSYPAAGRGGQLPNPAPNAPNQVQQLKEAAKPERPAGGRAGPPCSHVLACFDLKTGKILWQRWIDSDVMSAPVAIDDELYATSFAGIVYKFKQSDGTVLSATRSRATSAPVVVGTNVYYTQRVDDGKKAEEAVAGYARTDNRQQFLGDKKEALYLDKEVQARSLQKEAAMKLDAGNGFGAGAPGAANPQAALNNVGQDNVWSMQAFQGSRLLNLAGRNYNCMGDEVVCTDPATGKTLWKYKLEGDLKKQGGFLAAPPAAAGGQIFLATLGGEVLQMDPKTEKVAKTYKIGAATRFQPLIENGRIYVSTQDGRIVCIDTGDKQLTGWPCWGANAAHTGLPVQK